MSDADRGPRMEQVTMPGPALFTDPLGSPLNRVLNGRLSSCEEGGLWGFPTSWALGIWRPSVSGKESFYAQAYADVTLPAPLGLKPRLLLKVGLVV
jgi:hypothetical protein